MSSRANVVFPAPLRPSIRITGLAAAIDVTASRVSATAPASA